MTNSFYNGGGATICREFCVEVPYSRLIKLNIGDANYCTIAKAQAPLTKVILMIGRL